MKFNNYLLFFVLLILQCNLSSAQVAVPFTQRLVGGSIKIKGDIMFVGNQITNTTDNIPGHTTNNPNTPYTGTQNNNGHAFGYVDVDGDPVTFSSSTADLNITGTCRKIRYAGLYWTATYPFEVSGPGGDGSSSNYTGSPRMNDWNNVKFKLPGGAYIDLTADTAADPVGQEDDIIFDGYNAANPNSSFYAAPYVCYKNVTSLLQSLANPNGTYTVANVRAARGTRPDGISSGWSLVVIYDDPALPSKYISVFDGYANINGANVDFNINGFQTLPPPLPVRGRIGVSTLEGDYSITGDNLRFKANSVGGFTTITNTLNPLDNFFNGSITTNNVSILTRTPASTNTLGFDLDIVGINNPGNAVLPNNETGGTIRLTTSGDSYGTYLTSFDVEIIEPKIVLTKTVQNAAGVDIGSSNVNLCQDLQYVIGYQNIGNDDAQNFTIRDVLPPNITFNPATDLTLPPGVTYTYNAGTRTIIFTIPNNQVNIGDPRQEIRIKVKVVCSCYDLDDACSNLIRNQAFATYQGVLNTDQITDDPSLSSYTVCNSGSPSPTNFLVGLDDCDFSHTLEICGNTPITLTAANGYQSYAWTGPGIVGPNNTQTITINQPGTYTVNDNINTSPCKSIVETFVVTPFTGGVLTNPVIPYADQVVTCPNDGKPLPYIFLCGAGDSQLIQTSIAGATSIEWQQLNTASCAAVVNPNCANENPACTWNTVATGANYTATVAGEYRIKINFPNGCSRIFYFNVYQNLLNPQYVVTDIICTTQGNITVTNVPAGYEYQLLNAATMAVVVPWQSSNVFNGLAAGTYIVQVRQAGVPGGCVFTSPTLGIRARNFTVTYSILQQPLCTGDKGSITISANDVRPQYTFSIYLGAVLISTSGPINPNNYTFNNLNPGTYTYQVTTQDGCTASGTFTITTPPTLSLTLALTKPLSCTDGEITANVTGGISPYNYIITPPAPGVAYNQSSNIITAPTAGTYTVQVVDFNNCSATASLTITQVQPPVYTVSHTDITCSTSGNTGTITFNVTNPNGSALMYSINGGTTWQASNVFTNLPAGTYTAEVQYTTGPAVCTTAPQTIVITIPNPIVGTATLTTPYTCTTTGVITVSGVSGGTPGYTYSIGGAYQPSNVFSGLTAGTYTVTIKDSAGCTLALAPITIAPLDPPTDLSFNIIRTLSCPSNTVDVNVNTVSGGSPPLRYYLISPAAYAAGPNASGQFNNLPPGTYVFEVRDKNDCAYQESFTINPLPALTVTPTVISNVKCFGTATGSFSFTVAGFNPRYNYTVSPGGFSGTNIATPTITINNVPAATYTITVTNPTTNCTTTATVTIAQPAAALSTTLATSPITCLANGQATVTASGGWGGNTYSISPVAGTQSGNVFSNLPANTYTITTTDSGGCSVTNTFTLVNPTRPTLTLSPTSDFCYDAVNAATLVVTASSGVAPYQFSINGGSTYLPSNTAPNGYTFSGLTPGTYTIIVKDAYGCTNAVPFTQTINGQLSLSTVITKDLDCTASPNAVITGTITAGYPGYTYQVNVNGGGYGASSPVVGSTFTYSAATAGSYQFLVTDTHGCTVQSQVININPLIPVSETHTQVNNTCFGDASGSVTITPSGGVAPYQINFNGAGFSSTFTYSGLAAGTYNFIVRDSKSCTRNGSVTITQPTQISYTHSIVPIQCNAVGGYTLGQICVNAVTGGTPGYTYTLIDNTGGTPNQVFVSPVGAAHCFTSIDFGNYTISVTDANGCTIVHSNIIMTSPPSDLDIIPTASIPSCAAGATVQVDIVGGVLGSTYEFAIMNAPPPVYVVLPNTFVAPNNGPTSNIFTGLIPGVVYTFVVRDITTGCYYFETMTAPTPTNSTIVPSLAPKNVTCFGAADGSVSGSVVGFGAGATSISYTVNYASSGLPVGTPGTSGVMAGPPFNFVAGPLAPGTYTIYFRENNGANAGCGVTSASFTISQSATILTLTTTTTNDNCNVNAGQIAVSASGGTAPYTYQYLPNPSVQPLPASPLWVASNTFNAESGTYDVYVKDANDCIKKTTVTIGLDPTPVVAANLANACAAQGSFAINVTLPTAGVGPYTYSIDGGAFVAMTAPFTISGLSSGAHSVQVRDTNGCGNTVNLNILSPVTASAAFSTQPTCLNADGSITVTASGGSGNYTYTLMTPALVVITGPQASNVFNGVAAGNYIVRVTDTTTSCNTDVPVSLALPDAVTFTTAFTQPLCNGNSNGTITVTLNAGNNNPTYTYEIIAGPVLAGPQTSNVFTGLPVGTYTVRVTSARGCLATQNVTITQPAALVIASPVSVVPFSCAANNSVNTATITINASGGTPAYTYSIDGVNYFVSNVFNVIDTGAVQNITVYVKDANGCIDTDNVTINPIVPLNATIAILQTIDCTRPEIIQINASGGSGTYTYQTLPSAAANVTQGVGPLANQFTITVPGTYYFRVTDATTGCYFDTAAHVIPVFNTINVVATAVKPVTCFGGTDGAISISVSGYSGAYNYTVLDAANTPVASGVGNTAVNPLTINGLPAGNFTVQVNETATPFCVKVSNTVTVGSPSAALTISAAETANVTCTNNQGVITATATGGWNTSYTYTIAPVAGTQTSPGVFSNLPANTYTITVTDALGCTSSATITLTQPAPIAAAVSASAPSELCFGDTNVSITIGYPTGGQGSNYAYTLTQTNPVPGFVSGPFAPMPLGGVTIPNLGAGTYVVSIVDGYNCAFTSAPIVITQPTKATASLAMTVTPSCTGNTILTLTGNGGTPPYTYSSDGGITYNPVPFNPSTNIILAAGVTGTFQYIIKDFNGCVTSASNSVTVNPITPLTLSALSHIDILCGGSATGSITAVANGGLLNYVYSLVDNFGNPILVGSQPSPGMFTNLPAGTYYVHVTSNDCTYTSGPVVITEPTALSVTQTPIAVTCNGGNNGMVHLTISGGTGTIQYAISPRLDQFITIQNPYSPTGFDIQNLTAGTYTIVVQDQNGCFVQFNNVVITQPNALGATMTNIVDEQCAEQDLGEFAITGITGGTAPYTVSYSVIYPGTSTVVNGPSVALPLGQTSHTFTNLNGGAYTAIVIDAKGCRWEFEKVVGSGDLYDPRADYEVTCVNNQPGITVTVVNLSNPPSLTFNPLSDYLFSLDVNNVASAQPSNVFTSASYPSLLIAGNHTIYVFSAQGCNKPTPVFTINAADVDPLTLSLAQVFLNKIVATVTGGQPPYTYTFDNHNNGNNNTYIYDHSGTYTVTVTDATGCSVTKKIDVVFIPICIPDFFTPDGDGQNDGWTPGCSENYPNLKTRIYDRYGRQVAELPQGVLWDGKYEGKELPSGDYWYVLKVDENYAEEYVGHFTLYR